MGSRAMKTITVYCFSDVMDEAESRGFVDPFADEPEWSTEMVDALEDAALEFLCNQGLSVIYDHGRGDRFIHFIAADGTFAAEYHANPMQCQVS